MGLAVVRDLREARAPASPDKVTGFETDALAGFVLARAAAGRRLARGSSRAVTISNRPLPGVRAPRHGMAVPPRRQAGATTAAQPGRLPLSPTPTLGLSVLLTCLPADSSGR